MNWARMLAYITGTVDQELLVRNEYLAAENRILKAQVKGRLLLSEADKATLAEIAHRLGRKALEEVAAAAMPDTILGWYRKLIANKFDGSRFRRSAGRPKVDAETEGLVVQMTNAFSKKLDNLKAACALHFAYYNFCRIHQSLRVTPAMEAGLADHAWTIAELIA